MQRPGRVQGQRLTDPTEVSDLLDWKRRIFDLYREIRLLSDHKGAREGWEVGRDLLFRTHPQSPIPKPKRADFGGVAYFDYDPEARMFGELTPAEPSRLEIATSGGVPYTFIRFATASFTLGGQMLELELYWLDAYGGGLFLPFRDLTSGDTSYGAGRYLLDTVKGADLGMEEGRLVLDFNFAYNPSCAYDPRWVCPLAPPANRLPVPIEAGERAP